MKHKHSLLLDENMPSRNKFPRVNNLFLVKHIRDDLKKDGISDGEVFKLAVREKRIIVTFNGPDFHELISKSKDTGVGVIAVSASLTNEQIDKKLSSLLLRSSDNALKGKYIRMI